MVVVVVVVVRYDRINNKFTRSNDFDDDVFLHIPLRSNANKRSVYEHSGIFINYMNKR